MQFRWQFAKDRLLPVTLLCVFMAGNTRSAFAADLRLIDAIEIALTKNPDIAVQRSQTTFLRGAEMQAKSQFDWEFAGSADLSRTITPLDTAGDGAPVWTQTRQFASGYEVGVIRQLRNGMTFGSSLVAAATQDTSPGAFPGQKNTVKLNVSLTLPLLRGSGTENVTGQESSSELNALASGYMVRDRVAQTVRDVAVAYWTYRSRIQLEKVAADAEEQSRTLLASTQKLVDNAEKPRADLVLLNADYADKVIDRKAATLNRTEAKNSLGRILGLDAVAIAQLTLAQDVLPLPQVLRAISPAQVQALGERALRRRSDVSAVELQTEAAIKLLAVAKNNLKPRMDLQLNAGYGKASEGGSHFGFISIPGRTQTGPSVSAVLNFQFPIENRSASGALLQSVATVEQLRTKRRDLQIAVVNNVEAAVAAVTSSAERIQIAKDGLTSYQKAIEHEVIKQRNGFSTLIDVINVESRYVNARINYLQLELEYAVALVNLNYAAGTLLPEVVPGKSAMDRVTIDLDRLQDLQRLFL
ncbi:TolC family protein [Massilia pinisoli]|uniref:TolC family protein n=1 Tax=Massilia pinisoli TaxID=1772194 RepID=A0ABT1ZUE5_9BURK|nr:TolC family protein [Massilia pinisoli]MCS0583571.1 TolC family protein [Massilia pinisoli]